MQTARFDAKNNDELDKILATLTIADKEDNEEEDLLDIDPVVLSEANNSESPFHDETFTEEELINALRSFEEYPEHKFEVDQDNNIDFPQGDFLPELDCEHEGSDTQFLTEFTSSIFEDTSSYRENEEEEEDEEGVEDRADFEKNSSLLREPLIQDSDTVAESDEDLGLLEDLQKLTLGRWPTQDEEEDEDDYDIPPYLYCQPCRPEGAEISVEKLASHFSLAPIAEDQTVLNSSAFIALRQIDSERPKLPEREFDSLLNDCDNESPYLSEAEMDFLFDAAASAQDNQVANTGEKQQQQQQQSMMDYQYYQARHQRQKGEEAVTVSRRSEALDCASQILARFVPNKADMLANERSCIGHKETIFGAGFSECGNYLATASQDSTVRIWDAKTNTMLSCLNEHSKDYECLRVDWATSNWASDTLDRTKTGDFSSLIATGGADGTVKVWTTQNPSAKDSWTCCATLDHSDLERVPANPEDEAEKPQVYSVQWIDHWSGLPGDDTTQNSFLLTSSDDFIHLWELSAKPQGDSKELDFREVMSLNFMAFQNPGYGVSVCQVTNSGLAVQCSGGKVQKTSTVASPQKAYGGERNPNNMVFVFDANYCPANGLLGAALSDGTLRLINGRGVCISIMQLPGCQSHLTSFSWDSTGTRLATSVATGHVILWGMHVHDDKGSLGTTCAAILEGGHEPGRPVFGSKFIGPGENLLLTWGVDGRLCLWDSFSLGNIHAPIAPLLANTDYPIYAVDALPSYIAVAGGGGGGGMTPSFLGVPVMIYDVDTAGTTKGANNSK